MTAATSGLASTHEVQLKHLPVKAASGPDTRVTTDGGATLSPADLLTVLSALAVAAGVYRLRGTSPCRECVSLGALCEAHAGDLEEFRACRGVAVRLGDLTPAVTLPGPAVAGPAGAGPLQRLRLLQERYMRLLSVSRAAVAARRDGDADPAGYVAAELEERGQVPPLGMHPAELLAATAQTAVLAGVIS
jgi:hypothetical protein